MGQIRDNTGKLYSFYCSLPALRRFGLMSFCGRRGWRGRLGLVCGLEFGLHLLYALGKFLGMESDVEEKATQVERCAGKLAKFGGERRAAGAAGRGDVVR